MFPTAAGGSSFTVTLPNEQATARFAIDIAAALEPGDLVTLSGELGAGKTVLTKGIVTGLGAAPESEVTSPTFALVHEYAGAKKVYHIDLYRIEGLRDFATLGLDEMVAEDATVIVEWGEKLPNAPVPRFEVQLEHRGESDRHIMVYQIASTD